MDNVSVFCSAKPINSKDVEDLEEMIEGIKKLAECPICLETVKPPVKQCGNGHISCGDCSKGLPVCSVCRGPFIVTINRAVEQLLDFVPKHCQYLNKGCKTLVLKDNHAKYCEFRPISCPLGRDNCCKWSGTIKEWKEHVKSTYHLKAYLKFNNSDTLNISDFNDNWVSFCYYHEVEKESFLFHAWKNGNTLCHTVKHVQCKKPGKEYYFTIQYVLQNNHTYTTLVQCAPFVEAGSLVDNPAVFLLKDLNPIVKNGVLNVGVKVLQIDYPENK